MRAAAILLALWAAAPAAADGLDRAAEMLTKAEAAMAAARGPKERLAAVGRAAQAQEAALAAIREERRAIAEREAALVAEFAAEERRLDAALAALERLERAPRAALAIHPDGALAAARAGMSLAALAPGLKAEAERLAKRLDEARGLAERRVALSAKLRASLAGLRDARGEIARLLELDRRAAETPAPLVERMREEGEALARAAEDLAALAAEAPAARIPRDPSTPRFAAAKGALDPPVEGRIVGRFGGDGGDGVIVEAPAYAEVYAPWRGVVRFAGPFGDEGVVVILEPEAEHLVVFSGLGLSRRSAGEIVAAGEPLGFLGGPEAATEEFLISSASAVEALAPQKVYMEVRQGGAPVDPEAWFAFDRYGR